MLQRCFKKSRNSHEGNYSLIYNATIPLYILLYQRKIFLKIICKGVDMVLLCYTLDIPKKGAETWIKDLSTYT